MPRAREPKLVQRLERAIERIEGVSTARVILEMRDQIAEVHVIGSSSRHPKLLVRDIESLLCARFGIQVDYRKISVVQLPEKDANVSDRLLFVAAASSESTGSVQVTLETDEGHHIGEALLERMASASGAVSNDHAFATAAARATLDALQKALDPHVDLSVLGVQTVNADDQSICLVILQADDRSGERCEHLTGTCLIRGALAEAACRATLDALNRRLLYWVTEEALQKSEAQDSNYSMGE